MLNLDRVSAVYVRRYAYYCGEVHCDNGTSSRVVALDFALPRSLAYLSDPLVLYF